MKIPRPRTTLRRRLLLFAAASLLFAVPVRADDTVVVRWNQALLQAVRNTGFAPMFTARALAVVHTSMYDAWAAYDGVAVGTRLGGALRRPESERTLANKERAVSYAAYRSLVDLFPTQQALFDGLMAELGLDPADASTDPTTATGIGNTAAGIGNTAADAVLDFRHHDGSNQLGDLNPGPYSDWTGYQPVNTPDLISDPNRWQPLLNPNGTVQRFLRASDSNRRFLTLARNGRSVSVNGGSAMSRKVGWVRWRSRVATLALSDASREG